MLIWMLACQFPLPVVHSHESLADAQYRLYQHLKLHHGIGETQPRGFHLHWMMPGELTAEASFPCGGSDDERCPFHRSSEPTPGVTGWWTALPEASWPVMERSDFDWSLLTTAMPLSTESVEDLWRIPHHSFALERPRSFAASYPVVPACALFCTSQQ